MILEIKSLTKSFGNKVVFQNIRFTLNGGSIVGLVGKNGVGKSTFLNCLANILPTNSYEIIYDGSPIALSDVDWKKKLGFVSDIVPAITDFTVLEYLKLIGTIYRIPEQVVLKRANDLCDFFFDDFALFENNKPIKSFSTGMLKKIQIIASVLHKPTILLLDEPFSGLDAVAVSKLLSFIKYYSNIDNLIIFTSHEISHHKQIGDHFLVLDREQLVFEGDLQNLEQFFMKSELLQKIENEKPNIAWD